jgi:hypothetical protein
MQTVVEMPAYLRAAKQCGMSEADMKHAVDVVSSDPMSGDVIVGSSGLRKLRLAGRGKGKSGGYRLITYFVPKDGAPAFLLWVYSKGDMGNLTDAQLARLSDAIAEIDTKRGK